MTVTAWSLVALVALTGTFAADELYARGFGRTWYWTCWALLAVATVATLAAVLEAVS